MFFSLHYFCARPAWLICSPIYAKRRSPESDQIKEYSVALDVFGRHDSFDQDTDSIVRVQANRLRKRLSDYYRQEGDAHRMHIKIPVGQYIPLFEESEPVRTPQVAPPPPMESISNRAMGIRTIEQPRLPRAWLVLIALMGLAIAGLAFLVPQKAKTTGPVPSRQTISEPTAAYVPAEAVRILCGASRNFIDRSGKMWGPDDYFSGGTPIRSSVRHIWRTLDSNIYRTSREGEFFYDIPLKRGTYELHLHFAETFFGPEGPGGGGEGSRLINVLANGNSLLSNFDVIADAGGARTADVKIFSGIAPEKDGFLHLKFSSAAGGKAMVSGVELLPGSPGQTLPIRIVARDLPYYSNDSHWWSSDAYFKGGQLAATEEPADGTDDPELYETERWGHFSYAVPVAPGKHTLILHFIERSRGSVPRGDSAPSPTHGEPEGRVFNVFCNGKAVVRGLNILREVGTNRPLLRTIAGLEPNAQGKLLLEFEPVKGYATLTAIELLPQ